MRRSSGSIQDTGIGIGPDFLPHIFDPFEREQTSTISGTQGVGLGLTIAERLVEAMHGFIQVNSQQGKGTWIAISLPLRLSGEQ
ncbi:ATP-binding protein [Pseudoflavonifractor sp. 60]|uniref:sensor histidine kinase n=1 Tax=Pseudoflavonifractor sp. 60 TaxID=2304576 RepID=UPI00136FDD21|nr:ATP-binding protein [Pseudoflavonifractor sp. 60]NBI68285.1 ATP-binding protein [Pseudoflavonifractor sp. 60]